MKKKKQGADKDQGLRRIKKEEVETIVIIVIIDKTDKDQIEIDSLIITAVMIVEECRITIKISLIIVEGGHRMIIKEVTAKKEVSKGN
jgi:hypothetical protein